MSYGAAPALQTAVFQRLSTWPALTGVAIYDAVPPNVTGTFVLIGPEEARELGGVMVSFPTWCRVTVRRRQAGGAVDEFTALEFWLENYAIKGGKEKSIAPNAMWMKRPYGQLAKCAEAQALRKAFPEVGSAPAAEEMEGKAIEGEYIDGATGEVVRPPAPPARPALEPYSAEAFAKNSPTWESAVVDGRKTPEQIISTLSTRAILSEEQKKAIRAFAAAPTDTKAPNEQTAGAEQ